MWSDGHAVVEVGLCQGLLLRLALIKGILESHVGQDDATCHTALRGGASEALKILVHAVLAKGCLDGPGCSAAYEGSTVLSLQHLHLAWGTGRGKVSQRQDRDDLASMCV